MELQVAIRHRRSVRIFQQRPVEVEKIKQLVDAAQWAPSACNKQGWRFVAVTDQVVKDEFVKVAGASSLITKAPLVIFVLYEKHLTERKNAQIQSAAAAIQNLLLTAHSIDLGATWLASLGRSDMAKKVLDIPDDYHLVSAIIVGYPKEVPMAPRRKAIEEIMSLNRYKFANGPYPYTYAVGKWPLSQLIRFREDSLCASNPASNTFSFGRKVETSREVSWVSEKLNPSEKILEIMPFAGTHTARLFKEKDFIDYNLFELSSQPLEFTNKKLTHFGHTTSLSGKTGEPTKLPYPDNYFSSVVIFQKLEMLPSKLIIKEITRVLKKDGRLYISFKNMVSLYGLYYWFKFRLFKRGQIWNYGPFQPLNYFTFKRLLKENFSIKREMGITPLTFIGKTVGRRWAWLSRLVVLEGIVKK